MATNSQIEWTDATWNPVTGCTKISPGCKHCYAERMAHRLQLMGQSNYRNGFKVTLQPQMLERPLQWKAPKRIWVHVSFGDRQGCSRDSRELLGASGQSKYQPEHDVV